MHYRKRKKLKKFTYNFCPAATLSQPSFESTTLRLRMTTLRSLREEKQVKASGGGFFDGYNITS
jgi:hypothetical protein